MKLKDLIDLICHGQNVEIRNADTDKIYYKGLLDDMCLTYDLKIKEIVMVCSSNDCDHDDYLVIEVS